MLESSAVNKRLLLPYDWFRARRVLMLESVAVNKRYAYIYMTALGTEMC